MTADSIFKQIKNKQDQIKKYCRKTGIDYLGLFGSVARREKRNIDLGDVADGVDKYGL